MKPSIEKLNKLIEELFSELKEVDNYVNRPDAGKEFWMVREFKDNRFLTKKRSLFSSMEKAQNFVEEQIYKKHGNNAVVIEEENDIGEFIISYKSRGKHTFCKIVKLEVVE